MSVCFSICFYNQATRLYYEETAHAFTSEVDYRDGGPRKTSSDVFDLLRVKSKNFEQTFACETGKSIDTSIETLKSAVFNRVINQLMAQKASRGQLVRLEQSTLRPTLLSLGQLLRR